MKTKLISIVYLSIFFLMTNSMNAQESFGGKPHSLLEENLTKTIDKFVITPIDYDAYIAEDKQIGGKGKPNRCGILKNVTINNRTHGTWQTLSNGDKLWRIQIYSEGAMYMFPIFSNFNIPEGAELYLYTPDYEFILGKFNSRNANDNYTFHTQGVPGENMIIEYYQPANAEFQGQLEISKIANGYIDMFHTKGYHGNAEGNCYINVKCEEGDGWEDQIRSITHYQIHDNTYVYMCSGALINNTENNHAQYIYTANHCTDGIEVLGYTFYFNYQTNTCTGNTGAYNNSVTGATVKARDNQSESADFMLLEITNPIPNSYNVYYSGWYRANSKSIGSGIHHPGGDWKKISIPQSITTYGNFWATYWITGTQNKGVTEGGSSGSPLFNENKQIIGSLCCGGSSCTQKDQPDLYGKFYRAWENGGTTNNAKKLKPWLDPENTGVTYLQGINWNQTVDNQTILQPQEKYINVYPNPSNGIVNLQSNIMEKNITAMIFDATGKLVMQRVVSLLPNAKIDCNQLPNGNYTLIVKTQNTTIEQKIVILK